jgi:hypothetical protein
MQVFADSESDTKDLLLEFDQQIISGWTLSELKEIKKCANNKRSDKSFAAVQAIAKDSKLAKESSSKTEFSKLLFSLNPAVRVLKENKKLVQVLFSGNLKLKSIPAAYALKGGAARIAFLNLIGINTRKLVARDLDLWRVGDSSSQKDLELSASLMPEDFKYGHGVELQPSLEMYFCTRDITINEVSLNGNKLTFSKQAFEDLRAGNIRLSEQYQKDLSRVTPKLICKMIRLKAELELLGLKGSLFLPKVEAEMKESDVEFHAKRAAEISLELEKRYRLIVLKRLRMANNSSIKIRSTRADYSESTLQNAAPRFRRLARRQS